jgi:hypothetical protein
MVQMAPRAAFAAVLLLTCGAASAQVGRGNFDVKPMNFDLWCQQTAHIAPDRCDQRLPEDNDAFEAYRAKIEAYEIPYLQQKNRDSRLQTELLHNDPTDRSATRSMQAQSQQGNQAPVLNENVP